MFSQQIFGSQFKMSKFFEKFSGSYFKLVRPQKKFFLPLKLSMRFKYWVVWWPSLKKNLEWHLLSLMAKISWHKTWICQLLFFQIYLWRLWKHNHFSNIHINIIDWHDNKAVFLFICFVFKLFQSVLSIVPQTPGAFLVPCAIIMKLWVVEFRNF